MLRRLFVPALAALVSAVSSLAAPGADAPAPASSPAHAAAPVPVVLKLDDLATGGGNVPQRWRRLTDFAREKNLKISIGVICQSLETGNESYLDYMRQLHASGLCEFWFHGYDHKEWTDSASGQKLMEFKGTDYAHQKEHFVRSQALAKTRLGFAFSTFGAPFNATDAVTARVLSEDPEIKTVLYAPSADSGSGKLVLDRVGDVNIENPLFVPDSAKFISGYAKRSPGRRYFVVQGHPNQWDDARWAEFVKIVEFLQSNQIPVVTPSELAATLAR